MDAVTDCPHCGAESDTAEFAAQGGFCPVCGHYNHEVDMGRHHASLRLAAIEFVDAQNTTDRGELMYRAHRHASDLTGQLPVAQAREVVKAFVAAVRAEAPPVRQSRTASAPTTLPDFDDQLLFDS